MDDGEIDNLMDVDENEQREIEGRTILQKNSLHRRIDGLSKQELEDIGLQSVALAERRITRKKVSMHSEKYAFTGYYQNGTNKFYAMKSTRENTGFDNKVIFNVKGGDHRVVTLYLDFEERKRMFLSYAKMLGFKTYKSKGRGFIIRVPLSNRRQLRKSSLSSK